MLEKFFRGLLLSDEQLRARRNSSAMWDALEALDKLKPGNWAVNKLQQHPDTKRDWSKGVRYFLTALSELDDDSMNTNDWLLIFGVRKGVLKLDDNKPFPTDTKYQDNDMFSEIIYCCKNEIDSILFNEFIRQVKKSEESKSYARGEGVRVLVARFIPTKGRAFCKDLYEDMHCALVTMGESIGTPISDEILADLINEKNNFSRPRYYGMPLSDKSLEEMLSSGRPRSNWRDTNLKFEASVAVKRWL